MFSVVSTLAIVVTPSSIELIGLIEGAVGVIVEVVVVGVVVVGVVVVAVGVDVVVVALQHEDSGLNLQFVFLILQ